MPLWQWPEIQALLWQFSGNPRPQSASPEVIRALEGHYAKERIRQEQQGLGKPIIAARFNDYQIVAVGNTVHWSPKAKTFPDFLVPRHSDFDGLTVSWLERWQIGQIDQNGDASCHTGLT